jgi:tetratricopeptide (TPR) repeat protein
MFWAASAVLMPVRASAEADVKVSAATEIVENPFAARLKEPRAVTVAPTTDGGPKSFHNPFSEQSTPPRMLTRVPRAAATDGWRRPAQSPSSEPRSAATAATRRQVLPAVDNWDELWPSKLRDARMARYESESLPEIVGAGSPPGPELYPPRELQQPSWLLPQSEKQPQPVKELFRLPDGADQASQSAGEIGSDIGTRQFRSPQTGTALPDAQADPFEPADRQTVVVSDDGPSINDTSTASELYNTAQQSAGSAKSLEDLAEVIEQCRHGLAGLPAGELADSLRSLAAWAHNRRGEILSDAGQSRDALTEYNQAIELDPNCWLALHNRAITSAEQGQAEAALRDLNRVVVLNPGLAAAYRNRGELLAALGRTDEAVDDYGRALAQLPGDARLYDMRGHALHRLGRYEEAIRDFDQSIGLDSRNAEAYVHRGNVFAEQGDYSRALDDLERALLLDKRNCDAYRSVAWLMATCPDPQFLDAEQALAAAKVAAKLSPPNDPFVLDALAAAHATAGEFERAIRYQQEAIAVAPESFVPQFSARLDLYRLQKPFRNNAIAAARSKRNIRQASLETAVAYPTTQQPH